MQSIQSEVKFKWGVVTVYVYKDRHFYHKSQVDIILFNKYCVK